jgi:hypothetical protein
MPPVLSKLLFILACVVLPIAWGVLVNWLFRVWVDRDSGDSDGKPVFPDYQI